MKTKCIVGALMLIAAQGCNYMTVKPKTMFVTFVIDKTDTLTVVDQLEIGHVKNLLPIEKNDKLGVSLTFYTVTDTRYTKSFTETLNSHSEMDVNDYERPSEVESFLDDVEKDIEKIKKDTKPLKQSYVFHPLFDGLNELATLKDAGKRQCIVLSDLAENSPFFSVYKKKDFALLSKDPEKFREKLEQEYPLERSLKGIEVFFIHQTGTHDDSIFHEMATFLEEYLRDNGATVEIAGSLDEINIE